MRKCTVNRILLLANLIWYCALFYSRSAWQIFSPNKAKTVRAFFYLLRTYSCMSCYSPGSRSLQVAGLQAVSQGGLGQPQSIKSDLDLRLPVQLWHNHSPWKCWNANQKNQSAPFYFLTSTLNRNTLTYFFNTTPVLIFSCRKKPCVTLYSSAVREGLGLDSAQSPVLGNSHPATPKARAIWQWLRANLFKPWRAQQLK